MRHDTIDDLKGLAGFCGAPFAVDEKPFGCTAKKFERSAIPGALAACSTDTAAAIAYLLPFVPISSQQRAR
jgi:hypothetical protein